MPICVNIDANYDIIEVSPSPHHTCTLECTSPSILQMFLRMGATMLHSIFTENITSEMAMPHLISLKDHIPSRQIAIP